MMGRGATFVDFIKEVLPRPGTSGEICGERSLTLARRLASPQRFPHRFAMQRVQPRTAIAGITNNLPD
jgi:hypothetical protein